MDSNDSSGIPGLLIGLIFTVIYLIALWKVYIKAGRPGWAAIVPFYNLYVLLKIAGKPGWWLIFYFIPIVNLIIHLLVSISLAKAFNRSSAFGIFMLWLLSVIGYSILGFGKSTYSKTSASVPATPAPTNPPPTTPATAQ